MKNKKLLLVAAPLTVLVLLTGYLAWLMLKSPAGPSYQTAAVQKGNVTTNVMASGSVSAAGLDNITTRAIGNLSQILVSVGQQVYPGTKIATVALNSAGVSAEQAAYNGYLANRGTPKAAASWQAYLDASGVVYATAAGTVTNVYVSPGMSVDGSRSPAIIATSKNSTTDYVQIAVSELDINKISVGQTANLNVPALPNAVLTGKVESINTFGVAKSGVVHYTVTISVQNPPATLLNGMSVDANIVLAQKTGVLVVPTAAVSNSNGRAYISVLRNGRPVIVPVKTGLISSSRTEIISGLKAGEMVITGLSQPASSGAPSSVFNGIVNQTLPSSSANQNN